MLKVFLFFWCFFLPTYGEAFAKASDFAKYFVVDMNMRLPTWTEYIKKIDNSQKLYDRGYVSRLKMGRTFNYEFSQTIKFYGLSEGRIKNHYEDELIEILSWLPKEALQYVGPMLHEVPGMSEKILNMPGIKETKNKFPTDVAEKFKGIENLEYLSPSLYFLLMPSLWDRNTPEDMDKPVEIRVKKPRANQELPDFLKEMINEPVKTAEKLPSSALKNAVSGMKNNIRTVHPTLTSPLTTKDAEAFLNTVDAIMAWGLKDNMHVYSKLIVGEALLDLWEEENGTALTQNTLKDAVNPCQRLVIKTRLSELYYDFSQIVAKEGFTPEEWGYTCDKTIKAFRVAQANQSTAYAVRYHRRGYYNQYINQLPDKWRDSMYATEEAIIKMYSVLEEDVEAVRPIQKDIFKKMIEIKDGLLTAPIIY